MKKSILILSIMAIGLFACTESPKSNETATTTDKPTDNGASQDDPDLVAIDGTIHGLDNC